MKRPLMLSAAIIGGLIASACGGSDPAVSTRGPGDVSEEAPSDGTWAKHVLGTAAADRDLLGAPAEGGGLSVLVVEEPGRVRAWTVRPGEDAVEVPVDAAVPEYRVVTAMTGGPAGLVALGSDSIPDFGNFVLTSANGSGWSEVPATGLDTPMDVLDLVATPDGYVAVGTLRTAEDPAVGGFVPVILTSPDGVTWSRAQIPGGREGSIRSVEATTAGLLAVGVVDGRAVAWRSSDGGGTWTAAPGVPEVDQVVVSGETLLAVGSNEEGGELVMHRSVDAGTTWEPVDTAFADGFGYVSLSGDDTGFAIFTAEAYRDPSSSPETCYADIDRCGPRASVDDEAVLVSDDGTSWERLDLTGLVGLFQPSSMLHTAAGDTVVLGTTVDGEWGAWVWAASQGPVPERATVRDEDPAYKGPPIIEHGAMLEEGQRYAFPLYIHCGMGHLGQLDGRSWALVDATTGDAPETGAGDRIPDDWPVVAQSILGYVTLISEDRIEYSLDDGQVIAVYQPIPDSEAPVCA